MSRHRGLHVLELRLPNTILTQLRVAEANLVYTHLYFFGGRKFAQQQPVNVQKHWLLVPDLPHSMISREF